MITLGAGEILEYDKTKTFVDLFLEQVRQRPDAAAVVKNDNIVLFWCGIAAEEDLKEHLQSCLTEYMVPGVFMHLEKMPLTPNGKIDRKALPEPDIKQGEYVAPVTYYEKALCAFFAKFFEVERIGVNDSLRSFGMNSIMAMKAAVMCNREQGYPLFIRDILQLDNIGGLAKCLENKNNRFGYWYDGFKADRKIIVWCCGIIHISHFEKLFVILKKKYNIYIFDIVFSSLKNFQDLSLEDVLVKYESQLNIEIPADKSISAFIGFSLGGEIAYHLACRKSRQSGDTPLVMMGDTVISISRKDQKILETAEQNDFDRWISENIQNLGHLPLPSYDGAVTLISATGENISRVSNERAWKKTIPQIQIIHLNDTHEGLYQNVYRYCDWYEKIIVDAKK